jgi:hypothetical protein
MVDKERQSILQVLDEYRSAYENRDLSALRKVWPNVPRDLQDTLKAARKIGVRLDKGEPVITGDTATVRCMQTLEITGKDRGIQFPSQSRQFRLRRDQGRWIIETDN